MIFFMRESRVFFGPSFSFPLRCVRPSPSTCFGSRSAAAAAFRPPAAVAVAAAARVLSPALVDPRAVPGLAALALPAADAAPVAAGLPHAPPPTVLAPALGSIAGHCAASRPLAALAGAFAFALPALGGLAAAASAGAFDGFGGGASARSKRSPNRSERFDGFGFGLCGVPSALRRMIGSWAFALPFFALATADGSASSTSARSSAVASALSLSGWRATGADGAARTDASADELPHTPPPDGAAACATLVRTEKHDAVNIGASPAARRRRPQVAQRAAAPARRRLWIPQVAAYAWPLRTVGRAAATAAARRIGAAAAATAAGRAPTACPHRDTAFAAAAAVAVAPATTAARAASAAAA